MNELRVSRAASQSLQSVLGESERIKALVQQAAVELSSVNSALKHELTTQRFAPGLLPTLAQSEAAEEKVAQAALKLAAVNRALMSEVRVRHLLEHRLSNIELHAEADHHAALHDCLTGLPNRSLFNDRLEHALAQAKRKCWRVAVMFVDLDDFKAINDALGHGAGDLALQTIAWRLRQSCRAEDTVCRYGGDEFLYLLCDMRDDHDIERVALKVVESIQEPCEVVVRGVMVRKRVEASLGIAVFPRDGRTSEALIKRADGAMYQAKRSERAYVFAQ